MTQIVADITPSRTVASWLDVALAAIITWALTWGVGVLAIIALGQIKGDGWAQSNISLVYGFFAMLALSGFVSWIPLLFMVPFVHWIDARTGLGHIIGFALGCFVGAGFATLVFNIGFAPIGSVVGGLMGAVNFLTLRKLCA